MTSNASLRSEAGNPQSAAELVSRTAVGLCVDSLVIFGANSLKTVTGPSHLSDQVVAKATAVGDRLVLELSQSRVSIDLQRTGLLSFASKANRWRPEPGKRPPTARLVFTDGSGLDFIEPAKTKRIGIWIEDVPEPQ